MKSVLKKSDLWKRSKKIPLIGDLRKNIYFM